MQTRSVQPLRQAAASNHQALDTEAIVRSFPAHAGPGEPGFITDFLGTRTRTRFAKVIAHASGTVEGYPIPGNFHATTLEWAGTLQAALEARDELVAVELGAGWAPWLVALARVAKSRRIERIRLVGVEANAEHCRFMREHFEDNGLNPAEHTLLHGIVGVSDGIAHFPVLADPAEDWGARADLGWSIGRRLANALRRPLSAWRGTEPVTCYSLATLLKPLERVDIVHFDIQGDEHAVIASSLDLLNSKVKRMVIGTHGTDIEQNLRQTLAAQGWTLEAEEASQYGRARLRKYLSRDGCQVWKKKNRH